MKYRHLSLLFICIFCYILNTNGQTTSSLLQHYRTKALSYNQELKTAQKQVKVAQSMEQSLKTENLPSLAIGGEAAYRANPLSADLSSAGLGPIKFESSKAVYGINATVIQPIYYGGGIGAKQEISNKYTALLQSQNELTLSELLLKTDRLYWSTVARQEIVEISQQYKDLLLHLTKVIDERVEAGMVGKGDLLVVEVKLNEVEYHLKQNENNFEVSRMALNSLIGENIQASTPLDKEVIPINNILVEAQNSMKNAKEKRPELIMAKKQVEISQSKQKLKMSTYEPQIAVGASASYGVPGPNLTDNKPNENLSAFIKIAIPIFEWGQRGYEKQGAELQTSIAKDQLSKVNDDVTLQIQSSYFTYTQSINQVKLTQSSIGKARENLNLTQERYDEGESSITDLIDAQIYLQNLLLNNITARLEAQIAQSDFLKSVGILNQNSNQ